MPTWRGSCHCGRIRFEADGELTGLSVCNCSICQRTGYLHWTIPPERFRLLAGADDIATYEFGTRVATRCLEGVDLAALPTTLFDGQNWEAAFARRERR